MHRTTQKNNTENSTKIGKSAGRAPSLRLLPWHLPYNWGEKHGKTSVRVRKPSVRVKKASVKVAIRKDTIIIIHRHNNKNIAIPLQAWTGPEGSSRLLLPDFKTIGISKW